MSDVLRAVMWSARHDGQVVGDVVADGTTFRATSYSAPDATGLGLAEGVFTSKREALEWLCQRADVVGVES